MLKRIAVTLLAAMALAACIAPSVSQSQSAPPRKACNELTHRQFDFWIGQWDVFLPDGSKAGENRIEPIAAGCALQESWSGRGGFSGSSLNSFDDADRRWHQVWVDSSGGRLDLAGGLEGETMVLSSTTSHPQKPGVALTQKISWTPTSDGSVRQLWQTSEDGGKTWATAFDGKYVRKR